ncbi:MAG TPA: permease prefix domain 1-containing protein [Armatimonadota bacterium]|nr:permease prefix domain 1-containing protein [Armatimonadota bacterium]
MDDRFSQLITDATSGLKDDPELRLDVATELTSHLEETARHFADEGMNDAESTEQAMKTFGSPLEVAGELLEANKHRMRLRALARLVLRAVVVPVAVLIALYIGYGGLTRFIGRDSFMAPIPKFAESSDIPCILVPWQINEIVLPQVPVIGSAGVQQRRTMAKYLAQGFPWQDADHFYQLWQQHANTQDGRIYFANYAVLKWQTTAKRVSVARAGQRIEPQNALYYYQMAEEYLRQGMRTKEDNITAIKHPGEDTLEDPAAFEKGLSVFHTAMTRPYLKTYHTETLRRELASLPPPRYTEDYIYREVLTASVMLPELAMYRDLGRRVCGSARLLIAQGRVGEAKQLLQSWKPMVLQMINDPDITIIHLLVACGVARQMTNDAADIYRQLGEPAQANQIRRDVDRLFAPFDQRLQTHTGYRSSGVLARYGTLFSNIILYAPCEQLITPTELLPSQRHEQTMLEQLTVSTVLILLAVLLLIAAVQSVVWLLGTRGGAAVPLLLLPTWKESVRIGVVGLLIPLVAYFVYSRLPGISGRDYGLITLAPRLFFELGTLMLVLLVLPAVLAGRAVHTRCRRLGIITPSRRTEFLHKVLIIAVLMLLAGFYFSILSIDLSGMNAELQRGLTLLVGTLLFLYLLRKPLLRMKPFALYYGTVARSLVPIYAGVIILLAVATYPYLRYNEARWLRADTIIFPHTDNVHGISAVEQRLVDLVRTEMVQTAYEITPSVDKLAREGRMR